MKKNKNALSRIAIDPFREWGSLCVLGALIFSVMSKDEKNFPGFTVGCTMYFTGSQILEIQVGKQAVVTMGDEYDRQTLQCETVPLLTMRDFLAKTLELVDSAIENTESDGKA
jgi:hypothetical protein